MHKIIDLIVTFSSMNTVCICHSHPLSSSALSSVSLFCFLVKHSISAFPVSYFFNLRGIHERKYSMIFCVWHISLNIIISSSIHFPPHSTISFSLWLNKTPLCMCSTLSLPICVLMDLQADSTSWLL